MKSRARVILTLSVTSSCTTERREALLLFSDSTSDLAVSALERDRAAMMMW